MFGFFKKTESTTKTATASQAKSRMDAGAVGIDVREAFEWAAGRIANSRHIPLGTLAGATASIPRDCDVILICASGGRSSHACRLLERQGFTNVSNLTGGIAAWKRAGFPLIR